MVCECVHSGKKNLLSSKDIFHIILDLRGDSNISFVSEIKMSFSVTVESPQALY